jgi:hypothetical protein
MRPERIDMGDHGPVRTGPPPRQIGPDGAAPGQFERNAQTGQFLAAEMDDLVGESARTGDRQQLRQQRRHIFHIDGRACRQIDSVRDVRHNQKSSGLAVSPIFHRQEGGSVAGWSPGRGATPGDRD